MGCDIHLHIEVKIKGQWYNYNHPRIDRDYDLFAKMANVRNDGEIIPISEPKGLPDDAAFVTKFHSDRWGIGAHSRSWLGQSEIQGLFNWIHVHMKVDISIEYDIFGYLFGNGLTDLKENPEDYPDELEDVRFVFWFDN